MASFQQHFEIVYYPNEFLSSGADGSGADGSDTGQASPAGIRAGVLLSNPINLGALYARSKIHREIIACDRYIESLKRDVGSTR